MSLRESFVFVMMVTGSNHVGKHGRAGPRRKPLNEHK